MAWQRLWYGNKTHGGCKRSNCTEAWRRCVVQVVIAIAEKYMRSADPRYPVGRTRLETVGVVACAVIMTIATIEVIQSAAMDLADGFAKGLTCPSAGVMKFCLVSGTCWQFWYRYSHYRRLSMGNNAGHSRQNVIDA